ncbi:MBL fold metallo-hydrolase [Pectobacterium carotovorum subsp. carotovorum]|nr:MBL fold metallo-hydrolase [Pectobacterium carotovorum subsp. carotovorum]
MTLKMSVLVDNHKAVGADNNLITRPGFSLLLRSGTDSILFDTGPDDTFLHNAKLMGISLDSLSAVVLSHGHYDHCGGVKWLLDNTKIICHPNINSKRYAALDFMGHIKKVKSLSVNNDYSRFAMQYTRVPFQISEKLIWSGEIKVDNPVAYGYLEKEESVPDYIDDEGALIYLSSKGLVIITGCGHRGIINIVRHCQNITGVRHIHALVGGFHLRRASVMKLLEIRRFLKIINPDFIMGCHCTGHWGRLWLPECSHPATGSEIVIS